MGFGHRVYKSYDPRAKIIKQTAYEVFEVTGKNPLLDIALELERIALEDEYFVSRKLYPNVDFYSGLIYQAMGFPVEMFAVLFAIARTVGWVAQWEEMLLDPDRRSRARSSSTRAPARATTSRSTNALGSTRPDAGPLSVRRLRRRSSALLLVAALGAGVAAAQTATAFDSSPAYEHSAPAGGDRPAAVRLAGQRQDPRLHQGTLAALGIKTVEQPFDGATPLGPVKMVNIIATIPGERPDRIVLASHFDTKLFRDFRFVGASDGALEHRARCSSWRGCSRRAAQLPFTIELLFLDGEEAVGRVAGHRQHLRQPLLRRAARKSGLAEVAEGAHPARHDRRPQPDDPPRDELDALADRHRLGHRGEARPPRNFMDEETPVEDDHIPFLKAGVPSRRHHRPRLPAVAHRQRHARQGRRAQPADRR